MLKKITPVFIDVRITKINLKMSPLGIKLHINIMIDATSVPTLILKSLSLSSFISIQLKSYVYI